MKTVSCRIDNADCNKYYAKGVCSFHYRRITANPSISDAELAVPKKTSPQIGECIFEGCGRDKFSKGRCHTHDMQFRSTGNMWPIGDFVRKGMKNNSPLGVGAIPSDTCKEDGCEALVRRLGRCAMHHQQKMQGSIPPDPEDIPCAVLDCKGVSASSYPICHKHKSQAVRFGLTPEGLLEIFEISGGRCRICFGVVSFSSRSIEPHLDHDHACCPKGGVSCGKCIRGILCVRCNMGLGSFKDNPEFLASAARYLSEAVFTPTAKL